MIRAENITFRAGGFSFRAASLDIRPGEYFVLLGPPGSGKTLFLEALCGLRRLDTGSIFINGREVTALEPRERSIGYVPQDYALFTHLTVEGNIRFGLNAQGVDQTEANRRVAEVAEHLGISHLLQRRITGLSGGERQRVALGRALVVHPKVLLLDEPVSALDESTRDAVCGELRRVHQQFKVATIHVSHHLEEAFSVADRAGLLRDGVFQQIGTLADLMQKPVNTFVAGFMRCQNILPAHIANRHDGIEGVIVQVDQLRFDFPDAPRGDVQLVIRPERIRLLTEHQNHPPASICFPAKIQCVTDRGVYLRIELDASFPLVVHLPPESAADLPLQPGITLTASIRPEAIHIIPTSPKR